MSLSTNTTYRVFVEKLGGTDPAQFVGDAGEVFLDPSVPTLKLSDGSTAGGVQIGGGGGGESYWVSTSAGIHTLSDVGIGTTNPTTKLQVGSTLEQQVIGFGTIQGYAYPSTNILIGDAETGSSITPKVGGDWKGLNNNFIGAGAGAATTNGHNNNFFGLHAGYSNTSGYYNNFFGLYAGQSNTTGYANNFFGGYVTGINNTTGFSNNFFGYNGKYNTTGNNNNFIGDLAGLNNTTGYRNNFIGRQAGLGNTTGFQNIFIGDQTASEIGSGTYNIFLGYAAGNLGADGQNNTFIGYYAGGNAGNGSNNVAIGEGAGAQFDIGTNNIAVGTRAGEKEYQGNNNIFLGSYTGNANFTPTNNKIIIGRGFNGSNRFDSPTPTTDTQFAVGVRTDANPANYWLVGNENFNVGIGTTVATSKLTVQNGDIKVGVNTSNGLILTDANGVAWRLTVNTDGTLATASV